MRTKHLSIGAVATAFLVGCSQTCTPAAVNGRYTLRSGPDTYELRLAKDGSGLFFQNDRQVGGFTWEWEPVPEQVFLNVSGEVLDRLSALDAHPTRHETKFRSAYFGMSPQCRSGLAATLGIGVDEEVRFSRVD